MSQQPPTPGHYRMPASAADKFLDPAKMTSIALMDFLASLPDFSQELEIHVHDQLESAFRLNAGGNNQLYVAVLKQSSQPLLVKKYYPDSLQRLGREYGALSFLGGNTPLRESVPRTMWSNHAQNYGVYTFESGRHKAGVELTHADCRAVVDFIIRLQSILPTNPHAKFDSAVKAAASLDDYINEVNWRLIGFQQAVTRGEVDARVVERANTLAAVKQIKESIGVLSSRYTKSQLSTPFPSQERRLSPMDFSLFSTIFRSEKPPCFVDFEYFGWDDPVHIVADFVQHDRTWGISPAHREFILDYYQRKSDLPEATLQRLPITADLLNAMWAARHLFFLTNEKIKPRQFAAGTTFDLDEFINEQLQKLQLRLEDLSRVSQ